MLVNGRRYSLFGSRSYRENNYAMRFSLFELWLHRWLFRFSLLMAAALALGVLILPWVSLPDVRDVPIQIGVLFATDSTLRQTAVVSAVGLWLTAVIFFRPREARQWIWRRGRFVSL